PGGCPGGGARGRPGRFFLRRPPPPAAKPPPGAAATEMRWPELHAATRGLTFAVDQSYRDNRLRVISVAPRDPELLRATYVRAQGAYQRFLEGERVGVPPSRRPLNLGIVPAAVLPYLHRFPDTKRNATTRYEPVDATLYLADLPGFEREDLPGGLALHFCPVVASMSVARCQSLADGFEKTFRSSTQ